MSIGQRRKTSQAKLRQHSCTEWSQHVEGLALGHPERTVEQAIRNFAKIQDSGRRLELAREIAETRQPELTLAYRNVVMVGAGYKSRTLRNGVRRLSREPCVIFVVRRKLVRQSFTREKSQLLPKHLLAYATINGERVLCAIPTDVQPETWFNGAKPRAPEILNVSELPSGFSDIGSATCAAIVGPNNRRFLISALHVFSPTPDVDLDSLASGASIFLGGSSAPFATSTPFGGKLRLDGQPSFDMQWSEISDWSVAQRFLAGISLSSNSPYAKNATELEELGRSAFEIRVPANNPNRSSANRPRPTMFARFRMLMPTSFALTYTVRTGGRVRNEMLNFWQLIQLQILTGGAVVGGDSGSAIVSRRSDGTYTLIGTLIASRDDFVYAIPAWQIFNPLFYEKLPTGNDFPPVIS